MSVHKLYKMFDGEIDDVCNTLDVKRRLTEKRFRSHCVQDCAEWHDSAHSFWSIVHSDGLQIFFQLPVMITSLKSAYSACPAYEMLSPMSLSVKTCKVFILLIQERKIQYKCDILAKKEIHMSDWPGPSSGREGMTLTQEDLPLSSKDDVERFADLEQWQKGWKRDLLANWFTSHSEMPMEKSDNPISQLYLEI